MPNITNEKYKKILDTKEMELLPPTKLDEWITQIPQTQRPRGATPNQCQTLLELLYWTGCRSAEAIELQPEDIQEILLPATAQSKARKAYQITLITVKRGRPKRYRLLPRNPYTKRLFLGLKRLPPGMKCFPAFISRKGGTKNKVKWSTTKPILIRENGETRTENITTIKEKTYSRTSNKIWPYISRLTGYPPHFFRHHRDTWMDEKGATLKEIADASGVTPRAVEPYIAMTGEKKKKQLSYF